MNKRSQLSNQSIMILGFMISLLMTGCDTPKKSLPSFAGKPRLKINPHQECAPTPQRPLNPFVDLDSAIAIPDPIAEERP